MVGIKTGATKQFCGIEKGGNIMPYIFSHKTVPSAEDRAIVDVALQSVVDEAASGVDNIRNFSLNRVYVKTFRKIGDTLSELLGNFYDEKYVKNTPQAKLAAAIYKVAAQYEYEGAHEGILNYAITMLIQRVPALKVERADWKEEFRYWVYATTVSALMQTALHYLMRSGDPFSIGGVFVDVKDEYKYEYNRAYEIFQMLKSGHCYCGAYYMRPMEVRDEQGRVMFYVEVGMKRSEATVNQDLLDYYLTAVKK